MADVESGERGTKLWERSSWESLTCVMEEGEEAGEKNVDRDAATGGVSICGTRNFTVKSDLMTSGTPSAAVVTSTHDAVGLRNGFESMRKEEAPNFPLCAPGTLRTSKFRQYKLLGRPRRVLRSDDSTGSDESIEVADTGGGTSSSDSIKSDGRKSLTQNKQPESITEELSEKKSLQAPDSRPQADQVYHVQSRADQPPADQPQVDQIQAVKTRADQRQADQFQAVETRADQLQAEQPQADEDGARMKGIKVSTTLKPLNGLEELKGELQALQMLSKQQRKLGDLLYSKPSGTNAAASCPTHRAAESVEIPAPRPEPKPLTPRSDGEQFKVLKLRAEGEPLKALTPRAEAEPLKAEPLKAEPLKALTPRVEAEPSKPLSSRSDPEPPAKAPPDPSAPDEANRSKLAADSVSRKSRESAHFVTVNNKRYQKLGKIGSGGSSDVFKVIAQDCTIYALKRIILKGRDHQTACGFHQEIEYLERLREKQHIIQLIDYEVTDKSIFQSKRSSYGDIRSDACIYMVLEYGEVDLARMLERKRRETSEDGRLDENWLRLYWEHILKAVNTIHEERIVHADLKPANFLLVQGVLKLIDFGIAKAIQNDTTNIVRDSQVGTLNYMSPEAFMMNSRDEQSGTIKCGRASDIWSLGCILYQMVYGRTPFSHLNFYQKITEITNPRHEIEFPPISNPHLMDVIKSCLVWDKSKRPRIPQLLEHPFLKPRVSEDVTGLQYTREVLLQSCKVYTSLRGTLELTELMRRVVHKGSSISSNGSSLEHQHLDEALLRLSRLYMQKAGKAALHELLTTVL